MAAGRRRPRWQTCLLLAVALASIGPVSLSDAQVSVVRAETPAAPVTTGDKLTIPVVVDGVTNLGAFNFVLSFDPAILEAETVELGPFLGSSGREVTCPHGGVDEGSVRLACVTLGATPDGPNGSGVLATVVLKAVGAGTSPLRFDELQLTDPPAQFLAVRGEDSSLTVVAGSSDGGDGFAWGLWGPVIAVALGVVAVSAAWWVRRSRSA